MSCRATTSSHAFLNAATSTSPSIVKATARLPREDARSRSYSTQNGSWKGLSGNVVGVIDQGAAFQVELCAESSHHSRKVTRRHRDPTSRAVGILTGMGPFAGAAFLRMLFDV